MFKNRRRTDYQSEGQSASGFLGYPKIFDDVDLYTQGGLAVNFSKELIFALRHWVLFEDKRGFNPALWRGLYTDLFTPVNSFLRFF
jgi:hypothetical protein